MNTRCRLLLTETGVGCHGRGNVLVEIDGDGSVGLLLLWGLLLLLILALLALLLLLLLLWLLLALTRDVVHTGGDELIEL